MDALARPDQMEDRTKGAIPATHPFLEMELDAASRLIRNACGWHIAPVLTGLHWRRDWHDGSRERIWIPAMNATITAATMDDEVIDLSTLKLDARTGRTNYSAYTYDVTYTAGYEDVPEDLVTLTLQIAARSLGSPLGLVREQAGPLSATYTAVAPGVSGGVVLLPHEIAQLGAYSIGELP